MAITYAYANQIGNKLFGGTNFTEPTIYYLGLSSTMPTRQGGGVSEFSGGGYARVAIPNNKTNFSSASDGKIVNLLELKFPEATANWGVAKYWVLFNSATGAVFNNFGEFSNPKAIDQEDLLAIAPGRLEMEIHTCENE